MSGHASGERVELEDISRSDRGGAGVRHGELLLRFSDAAVRGTASELARLRAEILRALGPETLADAAAVVAIFFCNVRVADATGIPLDEPNADSRLETAEIIGIRRYDSRAVTSA